MFISPSTPAVSKDCTTGPPIFPTKGSYENCGRYSYSHGERCELKCDKDYLFFIDNRYYTEPVYFECSYSEWISTACPTGRTCGTCIPRPPGPNDCKECPPNIYAGRYYNCLNKDDIGSNTEPYFEGESCNFRCLTDGAIERPKEKCLNSMAPDSAKERTGLPRCSDLEVPYDYSGKYTCRKGKWVSSFQEIRETNKTVECKPPPVKNCGNEPPQISKAKWINCYRRRQYQNGDRCTFECDFDYVLSSNKMVRDGNYDRVGYYMCTEGEWKSLHRMKRFPFSLSTNESYGKLYCVTITQLVQQNIG